MTNSEKKKQLQLIIERATFFSIGSCTTQCEKASNLVQKQAENRELKEKEMEVVPTHMKKRCKIKPYVFTFGIGKYLKIW